MKVSKAPSRPGASGTRGVARPPRIAGSGLLRAGRLGWAVARRRPGPSLAVLAVALGSGLFGWNVLMRQGGPHPAPLFGAKPAAEPARRAEAAPPAPPARRPDIALASLQTGGIEPSPRAAAADPIGALIRGGEARPAAPAAAEPPKPEPARVSFAQKALSRLGYGPLKPDGIMGATTRGALERFERDHKLPVTGALGGRTVRQLAAASGLSQD